MKNMEFFRK